MFSSLQILSRIEERKVSAPHLSIHLAPNDGKEASIHGSGAEPHSNLDEDVGDWEDDGDGEVEVDNHEDEGKRCALIRFRPEPEQSGF